MIEALAKALKRRQVSLTLSMARTYVCMSYVVSASDLLIRHLGEENTRTEYRPFESNTGTSNSTGTQEHI